MNKLDQLIKRIEGAERLARFAYKDVSGCMCAVGHVLDDCGVLDEVKEKHNSMHVFEGLVPEDVWDTIRYDYGLGFIDLKELQVVNDSTDDPTDRKVRVIRYLKELAGVSDGEN